MGLVDRVNLWDGLWLSRRLNYKIPKPIHTSISRQSHLSYLRSLLQKRASFHFILLGLLRCHTPINLQKSLHDDFRFFLLKILVVFFFFKFLPNRVDPCLYLKSYYTGHTRSKMIHFLILEIWEFRTRIFFSLCVVQESFRNGHDGNLKSR